MNNEFNVVALFQSSIPEGSYFVISRSRDLCMSDLDAAEAILLPGYLNKHFGSVTLFSVIYHIGILIASQKHRSSPRDHGKQPHLASLLIAIITFHNPLPLSSPIM